MRLAERAARAHDARLAIVTGGDGPVGLEVARGLAESGTRVILTARSPAAGMQAAASIRRDVPQARLEVRSLDLSQLVAVRNFVAHTLRTEDRIDLLVSADAVGVSPTRVLTADGFEVQLAANFLGPVALAIGLMPALLVPVGARVVTVSSPAVALGRIDLRDLNSERRYHPFAAYAQSRLAGLIVAVHLATLARRHGWDLISTAAHGGNVRCDPAKGGCVLPRGAELLRRHVLPSHAVTAGVRSLLFAATSPQVFGGAYCGPDGRLGLTGAPVLRALPRRAADHQTASALWREAHQLTGAYLPAR